ncbi:hypothetical protein SRHO_G00135210 [Serrasalmus rhombeus]
MGSERRDNDEDAPACLSAARLLSAPIRPVVAVCLHYSRLLGGEARGIRFRGKVKPAFKKPGLSSLPQLSMAAPERLHGNEASSSTESAGYVSKHVTHCLSPKAELPGQEQKLTAGSRPDATGPGCMRKHCMSERKDSQMFKQ